MELLMRKLIVLFVFLMLTIQYIASENYSREIKLSKPRMFGTDIVQVQEKLLSIGFSIIVSADGWYGPITEQAIRKYQEYFGFKPNGIVDNNLWEVLFSNTSLITQINQDIKIAESFKINDFSKIEEDIIGQSSEGGSFSKYLDNGKIKYAEIVFYEEIGKVNYRIYAINTNYIIIANEYNYPKMFDVEHAKIDNVMYYYTGKTTFKIQNGKFSKIEYDEIKILEILDK
jgi:Putative peptidoglycan-binding domain-containing protein